MPSDTEAELWQTFCLVCFFFFLPVGTYHSVCSIIFMQFLTPRYNTNNNVIVLKIQFLLCSQILVGLHSISSTYSPGDLVA